ncbi:MAG: hypothetical protein AAGU11_11050 [Syntrophobacteraceae bacterium]
MTEKIKWTRCRLKVDKINPLLPELVDMIGKLKEGFVILQSHTAIHCAKSESTLGMPAEVFAGRAFNATTELRWTVENGNISLLTISEEANPNGPHERADRRYYLYGTWNGTSFQEAVVRRANLEFPLDTTKTKPDDRPYVEVALYAQAPPSKWPDDADEILRILNRPAICGHRLLSLKQGRG